ncbi:hypothetical protein [Chryseobacterium echinoideorum]|uniref:hypothetical protein n=1 Tax=Chryseobacterium echinoideorum TaxID=1549648 RepID=UPI0011847D08|nr:hypothetical protein [Chryseobacterium echinoideorum]
MKNKFIAFSLAIIGICTVACRQSDESFEEDFKISKENVEEPQMTARDSSATGMIPGDPPRNGTHWRTAGKNKDNPKDHPKDTPEQGNLIVVQRDSLNSSTEIIDDGNGGGDPPRNGTHWRTR